MTKIDKQVNTKNRQVFVGTVVSNKMKDTAVVSIERLVKHPQYHKFMMRKTKIFAHDVGNKKNIGDVATIEACRPLSKNKAFKVIA
jgi:small subunit ribosomal protein S17